MFSAEQAKSLSAPLSASHVKTRQQAGRSLSYIEGWLAISEANRIFGFENWDRETVSILALGEPRDGKDKHGNEQWRVAFMARVKITVRAGDTIVTREGCGYGSGIAKDLGDAYESALKEAETDAMKRALMTFGNPFGLALYDKTQAGVERETKGGTGQAGQISAEQTASILNLIAETKTDIEIFCKHFGIDAVPDLSASKYDDAISALNRKKKGS